MALVWAWQCQCQWQRPPPPWQVSRDPPWCGLGLRESKFSFDSDATGGRRSNQRAVAPNQPTTPVTHQAPESTTSAFNFLLFICVLLLVCVLHLFTFCLVFLGKGHREVECVVYSPELDLANLARKRKKENFLQFVCWLSVCLLFILVSLAPDLDNRNYRKTISSFALCLFVICLFVCFLFFSLGISRS